MSSASATLPSMRYAMEKRSGRWPSKSSSLRPSAASPPPGRSGVISRSWPLEERRKVLGPAQRRGNPEGRQHESRREDGAAVLKVRGDGATHEGGDKEETQPSRLSSQ